ncbi:methylmalonyl-CoA epimerase [Acidobacteriota bacterium]
MIKTIDHIGIAVKDIEQSLHLWKTMLGLQDHGIEKIKKRGVQVVRLDGEEGPSVELVSSLGETSPIDKFLKDRGEGIHHICFKVLNIDAAVNSLQKRGVKFVDSEPREGSEGSLVAFISPGCFNGVLIELKEEKKESENQGSV